MDLKGCRPSPALQNVIQNNQTKNFEFVCFSAKYRTRTTEKRISYNFRFSVNSLNFDMNAAVSFSIWNLNFADNERFVVNENLEKKVPKEILAQWK